MRQQGSDHTAQVNPIELPSVDNYDERYLTIYKNLCKYMIDNVQVSVNKIIDLSEEFLEKDISGAINDFHKLYQNDGEIDGYKNSINQHVDRMIDVVRTTDNELKLQKELDKIDDSELKVTRLSFSNLQKDIEALITLEADIKNKVMPIIMSLQFEEQIQAQSSIEFKFTINQVAK